MSKVSDKTTIAITYTVSLDDGREVYATEDGKTELISLGSGQTLAALEKGVMGMEVGESRIVKITSDQAFGAHKPGLIIEFSRNELPKGIVPEVGMVLERQDEHGETISVTIQSIQENTISIDANHPLAGKDLSFHVSLIEILE